MAQLKRRPRGSELDKNGGLLIKDSLRNIKRNFDSKVLDIVIDLGLILEFIGKPDEEGNIHFYDENTHLMVAKDTDPQTNYYVFETTNEINKRIKLFHATVYETGTVIGTFQRGEWENQTRNLAETILESRKTKEIETSNKD